MQAQRKPDFSLMAFLAISFGVVGLVGVFATYAIPIPYERLLAQHPQLASGAGRQLVAEAHATASRIRLLIGVATVAAALFGMGLMGAAGRRAPSRGGEAG
ncbi:MAG: hypothetical protein KGK10_00250 [Rhodospirillales bacterium]|nr:hypothetical protein [Rhodospirillales bacterium]